MIQGVSASIDAAGSGSPSSAGPASLQIPADAAFGTAFANEITKASWPDPLQMATSSGFLDLTPPVSTLVGPDWPGLIPLGPTTTPIPTPLTLASVWPGRTFVSPNPTGGPEEPGPEEEPEGTPRSSSDAAALYAAQAAQSASEATTYATGAAIIAKSATAKADPAEESKVVQINAAALEAAGAAEGAQAAAAEAAAAAAAAAANPGNADFDASIADVQAGIAANCRNTARAAYATASAVRGTMMGLG